MTLRAYLANAFEHSHEDEMFIELYKKASELFNDKEALLIGNPTLGGTQFDAIMFKEDAITIIEMKDYSGKIQGEDSEKAWFAVNNGENVPIAASGQSNPFKQVKSGKTTLWQYMEKNLKEIFGDQKGKDMKEALCHISGIVLFRGPIENKLDLDKTTEKWFSISDIDSINKDIQKNKSKRININNEEINNISMVIFGGELALSEAEHKFEELESIYGEKPNKPQTVAESKSVEKTAYDIGELLKQYKDNTIYLDMAYQWVSNPTSMTAIKNGADPNHDHIKNNIIIR